MGFQWLVSKFGLELVQKLPCRSRSGTVRGREVVNGQETLTWTAQYRPEESFRGHFEFGLKYERLNLEFLSRLFARIEPEEVAAWVRDAPTGAYARRTAFFYEWFTGRQVPAPDTQTGNYVDAIDPKGYLVGQPIRNKRWRVNDNLPGSPIYCPLVYLGPYEQREWLYDVSAGVKALDETYGSELLLRSAAWLTFKESRASFQIEHEADQEVRIRRFASAIAQFSGRLEEPLRQSSLVALQSSVLGQSAMLRMGVRQSPVFVGESGYREVIHYVGPDSDYVPAMLDALQAFELRTRGANSVIRAAAVSFAFVYLHPLADGNGRIHRFLINHLLAADGVVPPNIIVPVSATIAGSARGRADYDKALEVISRPLMQRYADAYRFGEQRTCPDGVVTNFEFLEGQDAQHVWRFPDLTTHAHYLSGVLQQTVEHEMAREAHLLRVHDQARTAAKDVVEMSNTDADRIIRSLKESNWMVSNKLRKTYPDLFDENGRLHPQATRLVQAVRAVFVNDKDLSED